MSLIDQQTHESAQINTTSYYRRKNVRMVALFALWLAYSAGALSWSIMNESVNLHCSNPVN
ncbi:MAG: hypothetical protein ACXWFA_13115 [Methylobacter sp.]